MADHWPSILRAANLGTSSICVESDDFTLGARKSVARAYFAGMPASPIRYLANLTTGRVVLWCYAIWYVVNVSLHFDPRPRLWLTSLGLSGIIGFALLLSTATGTTRLDRWQLFRLFLMPFCVSSFAALVKDVGYFLIFPPSLRENGIGLAAIAVFLAVLTVLKRGRPSD